MGRLQVHWPAAQRVDSDGTVTRYAIADPPTYWWFWPWMVTNAARFVDMETGEWYPDRARTVESLEFHREIGIDLQLRGGALGGFQDGDVAMLMSSIPQEPILRDGSPRVSTASFTCPSIGCAPWVEAIMR